jgi:hypothetical protein
MFVSETSKETVAAKYLIENNGLRLIALHEDMRVELNKMFEVDNSVIIKNGVDFNKIRNVSESKEEILFENKNVQGSWEEEILFGVVCCKINKNKISIFFILFT